MKLSIINGPNLNLLGKRETNIYGNQDFDVFLKKLNSDFKSCSFSYFQSNIEGELIGAIQKFGFDCDGIILNAGAYTHTSIGISDAIKAVESPVIEVHISNTASREDYRHKSFITPVASGLIMGFGLMSYYLAVQSFVNKSL